MTNNPEQFLAEVMVQSWDQHIGEDGARAIMRELDKAGLVIVPKELTPEMGAAGYSEMTNLGGHSVETMWQAILAAAPKS